MNYWIKLIFDKIASFFGFLIAFPLLIVIGILIKLNDPKSSILFTQLRCGLNGKLFKMYKFRTMVNNHNGNSISVLGDNRITSIGRILRKYKLDELPELWNILIGDMSFVGPRPDVPEYIYKMKGHEKNILKLKPGLTGPATLLFKNEEYLLSKLKNPIKFNDEILFPKKIEINLNYYSKNNFLIDIKIILKTIFVLNYHSMWKTKKILLYGLGGHSKVVKSIIEDSNHTIEAFFDDNFNTDLLNSKLKIISPYDFSYKLDFPLIISVGDNKMRKIISEKITHDYTKAIHPSALIDKTTKIGIGSVVMHFALIQCDSIIGKHCIINSNASVDHECVIDDFAHIGPNATLCGNVSVGEGTLVGARSIIIPNLKIGKWCVIGAGAVVINDVPDFATVVGNPARIIKINTPNE